MRRTQFVLWQHVPAEIRKRLADGIAGSSLAQPPPLLTRDDPTPPSRAGIRWWTIFVSAFAFLLYALALATNAGGPVNYGTYCTSGAPLAAVMILHLCLVASGAFTLLFVWRDGVTVDLPRGVYVYPTDLVEVLDHGIRVSPLTGASVTPVIQRTRMVLTESARYRGESYEYDLCKIRVQLSSGETQEFLADPHSEGGPSSAPAAVARAGEIAAHIAAAVDAVSPDAALQHLAVHDVFRGFRSPSDGALRSGSDASPDTARRSRAARLRHVALAVLATVAIVVPVDLLRDRGDSRCGGPAAERGY